MELRCQSQSKKMIEQQLQLQGACINIMKRKKLKSKLQAKKQLSLYNLI